MSELYLENKQENMPAFDLAETLREKYRGRGLAKEVADAALRCAETEALTASEYPEAYALWSTDEELIDKKYRTSAPDGERYMDTEGFVRYFKDSRRSSSAISVAFVDRSFDREGGIKSPVSAMVSASDKISKPASIKEAASTFISEWIRPTSEKESRIRTAKLSLSATISVFAVFISLMLIVASSVMIGVETGKVGELEDQLSALESEKAELQTELDIKNDLIDIRDVAINDLGMIDEAYISSKYVTVDQTDTIENIDVSEESEFDLAAILSAIGFGNSKTDGE